jgi:hypothetical protein
VRRENDEQPIYEPYSAADHDGEDVDDDDDDDERGRDLRDSVSTIKSFTGKVINCTQDNPLRQWAEDHRTMYLSEMLRHEGRGDQHYTTCPRCPDGKPDHRCKDCIGGGELLCETCMLSGHRQLPFHRIEVSCVTLAKTLTYTLAAVARIVLHPQNPQGHGAAYPTGALEAERPRLLRATSLAR